MRQELHAHAWNSTCWLMPAVCLLYLWAASPGYILTCSSDLQSFLLRLLLFCGIYSGGRQQKWQQDVNLVRPLENVHLSCLLGHVPRSYCAGSFMVELPEQNPKQGQVDSRNPCPASSTPPLSRADFRKVDLWGLAFTPLNVSFFGPKTFG